MSMKLIGRRPVQYALEGYAKPGDTHIEFPDANKINPTPNQYQVRPGVGMWVATLTASDPGEEIRITIQNGESATGVGSVSTCGRIENPDLWILSNPARSLKQETRYVLTLTKTAPPLRNCKGLALVGVVLNGFTQNRHHPRRGRIHPHRRFRLAHPYGQESSLGGSRVFLRELESGRLPHRGAAVRGSVQSLTVDKRGQYHAPSRGGVPRGQATVLRLQRRAENHPTVALAGGERRGA